MAVADKAFDEETLEWADRGTAIFPLELVPDPQRLIERLKVNDWEPLLALRRTVNGPSYAKLRLRRNPSETFFVVALKQVTITRTRQGGAREKEADIVPDLVIDRATFERLAGEAGLQR
jgi:hypothetical protein